MSGRNKTCTLGLRFFLQHDCEILHVTCWHISGYFGTWHVAKSHIWVVTILKPHLGQQHVLWVRWLLVANQKDWDAMCLRQCQHHEDTHLSIYLSIHLSIFLSIHPSTIHPSIHPPIHPSIHPPVNWSVHIYLSTYLSIYLSIYLSNCLSNYLPIYLSFYLSTYIYIYIYLTIYLSLSIYLFIYLCIYVPHEDKLQLGIPIRRHRRLAPWWCHPHLRALVFVKAHVHQCSCNEKASKKMCQEML